MTDIGKVILSYEKGAYTTIGYFIELLRVAMLWGAAEFRKEVPGEIVPEFREFLIQVTESGELPLMACSTLRSLARPQEFKKLLSLFEIKTNDNDLGGFSDIRNMA
jgi:hypothetical protein